MLRGTVREPDVHLQPAATGRRWMNVSATQPRTSAFFLFIPLRSRNRDRCAAGWRSSELLIQFGADARRCVEVVAVPRGGSSTRPSSTGSSRASARPGAATIEPARRRRTWAERIRQQAHARHCPRTHRLRNLLLVELLVSVLDGDTFWSSALRSRCRSARWITVVDGEHSSLVFLRCLTSTIGLDADVRHAIVCARPLTSADMYVFDHGTASRQPRRRPAAPGHRRSTALDAPDDFEQTGHRVRVPRPHRSRPAIRPIGAAAASSRGIRTPAA